MASPNLNSVSRLVADAYQKAEIIGFGQVPNSERYAVGFNTFNDLVAFQLTEGIKLFTQVEVNLGPPILAAGIRDYVFGPTGAVVMPRPYRVEMAWYADAYGSRRPLTELSWNEWGTQGNILNQGSINQYQQIRNENNLTIRLWQVPDSGAASGTITFLMRQQLTPAVSLADDTQFPREYYLPLVWMLADELAVKQPDDVKQRVAAKAMYYKERIEGWDQETAQVFFAPDERSGYARTEF